MGGLCSGPTAAGRGKDPWAVWSSGGTHELNHHTVGELARQAKQRRARLLSNLGRCQTRLPPPKQG